jgi:hypothetical protein
MTSSKEGKLGSEDIRISNAWNSLIGSSFNINLWTFLFQRREMKIQTHTFLSILILGRGIVLGRGL